MGERALFIVLGALVGGCYSGLGTGPDGAGPAAADGAADGDDGQGEGADEGDDGEDGPDPAELGCDETPLEVGVTPLRRLSQAQYNATVLDLLGDATAPADAFVDDELRSGFPSNESSIAALQLDQYRQAARTLASTAAAHRFEEWMPCDRTADACVAPFIEAFGRDAYRRPLSAEESAAYLSMYQQGREEWGAEAAVELVVQTMLMSPHFLYHVEVGVAGDDGDAPARLTPWEKASRLSYFLWGTMPDATLFDAAAAGELDDKAGVEGQARRMLADQRAADMVATFGDYWLGLSHLGEAERDPTAFPEWDPALLEAMQLETRTFVEQVVLEGDGRLETLLGASYSYLDHELAAHYGVELGDEPLGRTELPPGQRAGVLTQGAVLVSHAYPTENSWVHRGKLVRERFLCGVMPPPPPDIVFENTNDPDRLSNVECRGCHELMDPIGKAFDSYDPTGRFVDVQVEGEVLGSDIGTFTSIPELADGLANSEDVRMCMAEQMGQFALSRRLWGADDCSRQAILETFAESDYNIRELIVAIATSDAFVNLAQESAQ